MSSLGTEKGLEALKNGLAALYDNGTASDLTIICGSYHFKVHQAILATQTQYFTKLKDFHEGKSNTITLKSIGESDDECACDDPDAIKCMIYYIYHLQYDLVGRPLSVLIPEEHLALHARVFSAAVKYTIPALRYLSVLKFAFEVRSGWNKPVFAKAVHIIYTTTPEDVRELRDIVAKVITARPALLNSPDLKSVIMDIDGLAWELLRTSKGYTAAMPDKNYLQQSCFHCGADRNLQGCNCMRICINCRPKSCPFCVI